MFLSSRKYDPGCPFRIRILIFTHPGHERLDPDSHESEAELADLTLLITNRSSLSLKEDNLKCIYVQVLPLPEGTRVAEKAARAYFLSRGE